MFYLYVDGNENNAVEAELVAAFRALISEWAEQGAFLVNQKHQSGEGNSESELPDWDIGLNLPLDGYGVQQANRLIPFVQELAVTTGCEFVFGVSNAHGVCQDLVYLDSQSGPHEQSVLNSLLKDPSTPSDCPSDL